MDISSQTSLRFDYAVSIQGPLVKEIHDSARRVWSRVAWMRWLPDRGRINDSYTPSADPKG
jgi:cardiolipin synthase